MLKNKKNAVIFSLIAMFLWGSAIPLIKSTYLVLNIESYDTFAKVYIAGIRFFMAGILAFIYAKIFGKNKISIKNVNIKLVITLAILQTCLQYFFYYIGLSNTSGVKSSIIQASNSFMIVIISLFLVPEDKISSNTIIALIIGTAGIILVNSNQKLGHGFKLTGEGFIFTSTFINALSSVLLRKYSKGSDPYLLNGMALLLGSLPLIIFGRILWVNPVILSLKAFFMLFYGAFITATSFTIWTIVLQNHSANQFGVFKLFIPIFGSLLSVIILGEVFTLRLFMGLILVLTGSLVLIKGKNKKDDD